MFYLLFVKPSVDFESILFIYLFKEVNEYAVVKILHLLDVGRAITLSKPIVHSAFPK
jgi:hypothetical protein